MGGMSKRPRLIFGLEYVSLPEQLVMEIKGLKSVQYKIEIALKAFHCGKTAINTSLSHNQRSKCRF